MRVGFDGVSKIFLVVPTKYRDAFFKLLLFSVVIAIVEIAGLAMIVPYIKFASGGDSDHILNSFIYGIEIFRGLSHSELVFYFGVSLFVFYGCRLLLNMLFVKNITLYSNTIRHVVASALFRQYSFLDYVHFTTKSSGNLSNMLLTEANSVGSVMQAVMVIFAEIIVMILMLSLMLFTDFFLTLLVSCILLIMGITLQKSMKNKISHLALIRGASSERVHNSLGAGIRNFKYIKLVGGEEKSIIRFQKHSHNFAVSNAEYQFLQQSQRYIIETLGFVIILLIVLYAVFYQAGNSVFETVGFFALAFYRIMPSVNRILVNYTQIAFYKNSLELIIKDASSSSEKDFIGNKIVFEKTIELKSIDYVYPNTTEQLFNGLSVDIHKGDKVAISGASGKGKSTLVDMMMGLIFPTSGEIVVDGVRLDEGLVKAWRTHFGYIPQDVYLFNSTVAENVVFGREYDEEKLISALKKANIYDFLLQKDGLETVVGDAGIQLSGGQKQRIAIARALYSDPDILVLDEATSALDEETESKIMDEIYHVSKDKTLIIIAHRLSTISRCNKRIEL